jgi:signal transduction histidine kinase
VSQSGTHDAQHAEARILVVDDEPANVLILERILRRARYTHVRSTTDSGSVMGIVRRWSPDLILLDLTMPPPDGFAILEELSATPASPRIPVLVLTASDKGSVKERAFTLGASDFVTKPFDLAEVLLRIRNLLGTRHLELALRDQNEALERRVRERTIELTASLAELNRVMDERQALISRFVSAQEEERRRIASDIHDDTIQAMVAAGMQIELVRRAIGDAPLADELDGLVRTVRDAIGRLRSLLFDVHPAMLEREGLAKSLRTYLDRMRDAGGPDFRLDVSAEHEPATDARATLYRIAQEALSNARKHAEADFVEVSLRAGSEGLILRITDDGIGFDPGRVVRLEEGHLGLTTMRERAALAGGTCRIESAPGRGTTVEVRFDADRALLGHVPFGGIPVAAETSAA